MAQILTAGTPAPEFSLHVTADQKLSLSELRGRPVGSCPHQIVNTG
jgi:peroxiredoxin